MRVIVDWDRCESNAVCMTIAPDVFHLDADDQLQVLQSEPPDALRALLDEAASHCPTRAITVVDQ